MSGDALRDAICDGDLVRLRALVDERGAGSVNYIDADDGWPLLLWAVKAHQPECMRLLLANGANVHIGDASGTTALHKAAYLGHLDCAEILLEYGARVNARNLNAQTPRDLAELFDRKEMLHLLADMGAPETKSEWAAQQPEVPVE